MQETCALTSPSLFRQGGEPRLPSALSSIKNNVGNQTRDKFADRSLTKNSLYFFVDRLFFVGLALLLFGCDNNIQTQNKFSSLYVCSNMMV